MSDVFSYKNNIATEGQIASSDFARIAIGAGEENALVQSCSVTYGQAIEEVTQVGSTQIFWMPGRPRGNISIGTLVGSGGFLTEWEDECGKIETASIKIGVGAGGDDTQACGFEGTGTLTFEGAIVESLTVNVQTGQRTIAQGAQIRVASMSTG